MTPQDFFNIIKLVGELSVKIADMVEQMHEHKKELKAMHDRLDAHNPKPIAEPMKDVIPAVIPTDVLAVPHPRRGRKKVK